MYTIEITRQTNSGTLKFVHGSVSVSATCYWDKSRKIPAGTYSGCSATTMASKLNSSGGPREAIYIPNVSGYSEIFIHMGNNANWSDGCIVINEPDMLTIYNAITPKNAANVTVKISG